MEHAVILAIDTALDGCSVAVAILPDGRAMAKSEAMGRGQSDRLMPMCCEILADAGLAYADLTGIAVTLGPGSFTGLRVGITTAKTLGLALSLPVFGLSTLKVIAHRYLPQAETDFAVILETKREDFYVQDFRVNGDASGSPEVESAASIAGRLLSGTAIIGDGAERFARLTSESYEKISGFERPDPMTIAVLAYEMALKRKSVPVKPLYLRNADVSAAKTIPPVIVDF